MNAARLLSILAVAAVLAVPPAAYALPGDPLVGVSVTATSKADGKTEAVQTNEFGVATFPSVKGGAYRINVAIHRAHLPKAAALQPRIVPVSTSTSANEASIKIYVTTHNVAAETVRLPASGPYTASIQVDSQYPQVVRVLVTMVPKN